MTKVIYILGRTDNRASVHSGQFIRETNEVQLAQFVTTSDLRTAKKFRGELLALKFLAHTSPADNWNKQKPDGKFNLACYEILIVDTVAVQQTILNYQSMQSLRQSPWVRRVFCSTFVGERPKEEETTV